MQKKQKPFCICCTLPPFFPYLPVQSFNRECTIHLLLNFLYVFLSNKEQSKFRRGDKISIVSVDLISECNWDKVLQLDTVSE